MNPDGATVNTRYMPTLGNGYLGLTVYDDSMFINGVYSGTGGRFAFLFFFVFCLAVQIWINLLIFYLYHCWVRQQSLDVYTYGGWWYSGIDGGPNETPWNSE